MDEDLKLSHVRRESALPLLRGLEVHAGVRGSGKLVGRLASLEQLGHGHGLAVLGHGSGSEERCGTIRAHVEESNSAQEERACKRKSLCEY